MYKFYLQEGDINEATSYYINIVRESLTQIGETVTFASSLNQIDPCDKVFVIHARAFFEVWLRNHRQHIVIWFQGVVPEETMYNFEDSLSKYHRAFFWTLFEWFALQKATKVIFVSHAMQRHYQKKYGYKRKNYFIMPCFNQTLNLGAFDPQKYESPSFIYAGSLSRWQCIEEMLQLFVKIKNVLPQATLSLYTKETEKAKLLCEQHGVDAQVEYVAIKNIQDALKKYKYGFIVRDNIKINNVATPTKMNSYMAAGVIPVYSDVIYDFREIFGMLKYVVPFQNVSECISKIVDIEKQTINIAEIKEEYKIVFDAYYSASKYTELLKHFLHSN